MSSLNKIGVVFVKPVSVMLLPTFKDKFYEKMFGAIQENNKEVLEDVLKEFPEQYKKEIVNGKFVYDGEDQDGEKGGRKFHNAVLFIYFMYTSVNIL